MNISRTWSKWVFHEYVLGHYVFTLPQKNSLLISSTCTFWYFFTCSVADYLIKRLLSHPYLFGIEWITCVLDVWFALEVLCIKIPPHTQCCDLLFLIPSEKYFIDLLIPFEMVTFTVCRRFYFLYVLTEYFLNYIYVVCWHSVMEAVILVCSLFWSSCLNWLDFCIIGCELKHSFKNWKHPFI